MSKIFARTWKPWALLVSIGMLPAYSSAATLNVVGCALADVQAAVAAASNGDVVAVAAGNCTWSGNLSLSKGIHVKGAGSASTRITMGGTIAITKSASHSVRLSGFSFSKSGGGNAARILTVSGAWTAEPPLIHDNVFTVNGSGIIRYETNGGIIFNNTFTGTWDESAIQHKMTTDQQSWSTADTLGIRDTDGKRNLYVEDNTFNSMPNQATDFDDAARVVFRRNTLNNSSFNTHGLATSAIGVRHYEIYGNSFRYPDKNVNQNWHIWLRGGTGVIYDNAVDDIVGQQWGDKTELMMSVRAAVDGGQAGCCTTYPCKHQVGQNHNGSSQFTDAVRMWNNSGKLGWSLNAAWNNSCGQNMANYLVNGRDFEFASSAKSGYTPYPSVHPLRADIPRPAPPSGVRVD